MISCPRDLSGFCPSSACGADTALLLSGSAAVMSPAPVPMVPDWAIALLVLVSILLLVSIFTCLLLMVRPHPYPSPHLHSAALSLSLSLSPHQPSPDAFSLPKSTCTCRRKSRGKLDLLSQKDSYHPMAEYLQYQSHGRYVSPNSKPNPYSQVKTRALYLGSQLL